MKHFMTVFVGLLILLTASVARAGAPLWSKSQTIKRVNKNTVVITCQSNGVSRDLSFQAAMQSCSAIAANEKNSEFTTKQLVVENRETASLYSEIVSNKQVSGLRGQTIREQTDANEFGYSTWLQVKFNLAEAKVITVDEQNESVVADSPVPTLTDASPLKPPSSKIEEKKLVQSDDRMWVVTTVPRCFEIIIRGARPRTHPCTSSTMSISINSVTDTEIIFAPPKGYLPKTLKIQNGRLPASYETNSIEVNFDPH